MSSAYETLDKEGIQFIVCPAIIEVKDSAAMEATIKGWLISPSKIHILDFKNVGLLRQSSYRHFVLYNQTLKANNKVLFCINVSVSVRAQIKQEGLTGVFVVVSTVEEAKRRASGPRPVIDVDFINPFIMATRAVIETQARTPLTPGKPSLRKPNERIPMEIAGVIALTCSEFTGSISICFRADVFLKLYENMVGEKHEVITREIEDAAGEILNIIFGQAKTVLNDKKGYTLEKALPTILVGEKLQLHHQSRNPAIVLPFESPAGAFHLEVLVDNS
jgi:chemotaxis protein CheX